MGYRHLVSLGSSFAAGPGIAPIVDRAAMRSALNYPHLLALRLHAELTDLTVSGATTETILSKPQRSLRHGRFAPQLDGVPEDADLVTITAGGNDLKYVGGMLIGSAAQQLRRLPLGGLVAGPITNRVLPHPTPDDIERVTAGLAAVVTGVRERAPNARVVLVDYLTLIGPDSTTSDEHPLTLDQIAHYREVGKTLDGVFAAAADRTGADLVKASEISESHAIGSDEPWVIGMRRKAGAMPFHPNIYGMRAVASAIGDLLDQRDRTR